MLGISRRRLQPQLLAMGGALLLTACGADDFDSDSSSATGFGDRGAPVNPGGAPAPAPGGNTNVSLGGSQDFGFFRSQVEAGSVPDTDALDAAGFFAEHHTELPPPACGNRICLQPMLAVMGNLMNGSNCTMLQLGLNSPIIADPGDRPDLSLAVVVDVSGSMSGLKIDYVRRGLDLLIDGMNDSDQLSIITYSSGAEVVVPMTPVKGHRVELRQAVDGLVADGATNLHAGMVAGYEAVLENYASGRQNRVILLSDGQPTAGITDGQDIVDASRAYNSDGIGLTTIGLGADFNAELMRNLALQADGNFYFLDDTSAVNEVFTEELSFFTVPVAFDLKVSLTAGEHYDFGRAVGSPFWENTARGGQLEVPSVFLAHRESDDDVSAGGGRRGGGSALLVELMPRAWSGDEGAFSGSGSVVATVDVEFREPGTNALVRDEVVVRYPDAPWVTPERGHFDAPDPAVVQKSFVMLNVYAGLHRATRAFHDGTADGTTVAELDSLIAAVIDYNDEVGDEDIRADVILLQRLRENLVALGIADPNAPPPRDPWPAD